MNWTLWIVLAGVGIISGFVNVDDRSDGTEGNGPGATLTLIGVLLALFLLKRTEFVNFFSAISWGMGFVYIVGYLTIGVVWSFVKWYFFLVKKAEEAKANTKTGDNWGKKVPQVEDHKDAILLWMSYWVFSMWWTLLNDPLRKAFNWVYGRLTSQYQRLADRMFSGIGDGK